VETYKQFLRDSRQSFGEEAAKAISEGEKARARTLANIKGIALSGFFGPGAGNYNTDALLEFRRSADEAAKTAEKAEQYMDRIFTIQRLISDSSTEWARMEREIAEYKKIAYDKTVSTAERQEALVKVNELIQARYEDEAVLRERLANMQEKMNGLVSSSADDIDKQNQLRAEAEKVVEDMNNALRETAELQATLATEAQKEAEARQASLAAMQAIAAEREALRSWGTISEGNT
jgi:chromosome segregation ATPase